MVESEDFDFVVVSNGIFNTPCWPSLPGMDTFTGELLHAASYREPSVFQGRKVLVVGAAFSGADIAADVSGTAANVIIAARRPLWYLPRYINGRPADLAFYSRAASERGKGATEEQRNLRRHGFFSSIVGDLPEPLVAPDPSRGELPYVAITDHFLDAVRSGRVVARAAGLIGLDGQAAIFSDGHREEVDVIIMATGYRLELPFFSKAAQELVELDPEDLLQPAILHESVWRPELPRLAFVGLYRGPYFAAMELQARWACGVFSGRLPPPSLEELEAGLDAEREVREQRPRPQFPHGDYVGMTEALAQRIGVHPTDILADEAHPLHSLLFEGPLLPFHYRLAGFGAQPALAEAAIRECAQRFPVAA